MALSKHLARLAMPHAELCCSTACRERNCRSMSGWRFSRSVWCLLIRDQHPERDVSPDTLSDWKLMRGKLWREFFSSSSLKVNPKYPDFNPKKTQQGLWIRNLKAELSTERHVSPDPISNRKMIRETLWREFFSDPSQWWDHRSEKVNPRYPDFKHKRTQQSLWLVDTFTPPWVEAELATMEPERLQPHSFSWNLRLRRHVQAQDNTNTLNLFQQMQREGIVPDKFTFVPVLNACSNLRSLEEGRRIHEQVIQRRCESDIYVANCLVDMYAKCGSVEDSWSVFSRMQQRDVVSWSAMIGAYVKCEQGLKALELFREMHQEGVEPNTVTFVGALSACASIAALEEGRRVHEQIIRKGCESDVYVANCLVDMYAKCGSIEDAWRVFNKMRKRDVISWNAMIGGYVKSEQGLKALELFQKMQQGGVEPVAVTFVGALNACASVANLEEGRRVHKQIIHKGCEPDVYVSTCLVDMYAKCGSIEDAWRVFQRMPERSVVSWNGMIGGYVKAEQGLKALELFQKMEQEGEEPNTVTFVGVLKACASAVALENGRRVHELIIQRGCESDLYVANCLIDMYAKCRSIEDAWSVFNKMKERTVVSWSAMVVGFVKAEQGLKALELFHRMQQERVEPDAIIFVGVLNACASVGGLEEGRHVHEQIIGRGWESDVYVANSLVDMYAKCGSIENAWIVFNKIRDRDVVSWNAMIGAYLNSEQGGKALELFHVMQQEMVEPSTITFVEVLNACGAVADLEEGRRVHKHIIQRGWESDVHVANCLVDMYAKCRSIEDAWILFDKMQERTVVSWTAMIVGCVKSEQALKALELYRTMHQEGVEPSTVTFLGVLNACASVAALGEGRRVHKQIIRKGFQSDVYVANCLIDMYAKCGSIKDARSVFNKMRKRDVVSWSAMIGGYAMHGHFQKAIEFFERMGKKGVEINQITFVCLLSACSHGGLVEEGLRYFKTMVSHYNVLPTKEHYACMVDLLGRFGRLEEAEEMARRMPMERDSCVWRSLLGACKLHGNIEMGERAAKRCWELDPQNGSAYVLLSNIYAADGKWDRSAAIEQERLKRKVWKIPGRTWIGVRNVVHSFVVDDKEHPQLPQIHAELGSLSVQLNEEGYIPDKVSLT